MDSLEVSPPNDPRPSKSSPHRAQHSRRVSFYAMEVDLDQRQPSVPNNDTSPTSTDAPIQASDGSVNTPLLGSSRKFSGNTAEVKGQEISSSTILETPFTTTAAGIGIQPPASSHINVGATAMDSFLRGIPLQQLFERERMILIGLDPELVIQAVNEFTATIMGVKVQTHFLDLKSDPYVADHIVTLELMIQDCLRGYAVEGVLMRMELSSEVHLNYLMDVYPRYNDSNIISGVLICGRNMDEIFKHSGANPLRRTVPNNLSSPNHSPKRLNSPAPPGSPSPLEASSRRTVVRMDNIFRKKLIRTLSHDVRAPFKVILSGLKFLETELYDKLTFAQSDLIQDLKQSCKDTACILQNIITFEKHLNQNLLPNVQSFHLYPVIDESIAFFQHPIKVHNIKLTVHKNLSVDVSPDGPLLQADRIMLYEALLNLLHNAIRFSPYNSEVTIQISDIIAESSSARGTDTIKADHRVRIEVIDAGPGVIPSRRADLFNTPELAGEGKLCLGMRCSRLLMDVMGGRIGLEDANGSINMGSRFFFELPMVLEQLTGTEYQVFSMT